jgi:hypothetical protein
MTGGLAVTHTDDSCVGRPQKAEEKKRKRVVHTLAPTTIALLALIADKLEIDAVSRLIDEMTKREARRLKISIKE